MTAPSAHPQLGSLRSTHRVSPTWPILIGLILAAAVAVFALPIASGTKLFGLAGPFGAAALVATAVVLYGAYLYLFCRRTLWLHEFGVLYRNRGKVQSLAWSDLAGIHATFSYHPHRDTITSVRLTSRQGSTIWLPMNWTHQAPIRERIWSLYTGAR